MKHFGSSLVQGSLKAHLVTDECIEQVLYLRLRSKVFDFFPGWQGFHISQLAQVISCKHVGKTDVFRQPVHTRSEEHTSELQSLMRISYAVFCLKKKTNTQHTKHQSPIRNSK